jgi:hypothetical protein
MKKYSFYLQNLFILYDFKFKIYKTENFTRRKNGKIYVNRSLVQMDYNEKVTGDK